MKRVIINFVALLVIGLGAYHLSGVQPLNAANNQATTENDLIKPCTGEITYHQTATGDYEIDNPCPKGEVYCGNAQFPDGTVVVFAGEPIVVTP